MAVPRIGKNCLKRGVVIGIVIGQLEVLELIKSRTGGRGIVMGGVVRILHNVGDVAVIVVPHLLQRESLVEGTPLSILIPADGAGTEELARIIEHTASHHQTAVVNQVQLVGIISHWAIWNHRTHFLFHSSVRKFQTFQTVHATGAPICGLAVAHPLHLFCVLIHLELLGSGVFINLAGFSAHIKLVTAVPHAKHFLTQQIGESHALHILNVK